MRILGPIVSPQALLMASRQSQFGLRWVYERSLSVTSTSGEKPCFLSSLRISFTAAVLSRRRCTSRSRTSPSSSTARQSQKRLPAIRTAIDDVRRELVASERDLHGQRNREREVGDRWRDKTGAPIRRPTD